MQPLQARSVAEGLGRDVRWLVEALAHRQWEPEAALVPCQQWWKRGGVVVVREGAHDFERASC